MALSITEITWTTAQMALIVSASLVLLSAWVLWWRWRGYTRIEWAVTWLNSGLLTLVGLATVVGRLSLCGSSDVSVLVCCWFAAANWIDLIAGVAFYPDRLTLLSGYVHHVAYIAIMVYCCVVPVGNLFLYACLEELPTFLMAVGCIWPELRTERLYGFALVAFRVVYHLVLAQAARSATLRLVFFATFLYHLTLVYYWYLRQQRLACQAARLATDRELYRAKCNT